MRCQYVNPELKRFCKNRADWRLYAKPRPGVNGMTTGGYVGMVCHLHKDKVPGIESMTKIKHRKKEQP